MKVRLDSVCESIADGDHQAPPKSSDGIPFITISCLDPDGGKPDFSSAARVPREYYDSLPSNRRARPNDVLLSVVGSLGIPYLVAVGDEFVFQRHIAILRPGPDILPEYLYYLLKSPSTYHYIDSVAQGAAQRTFTLAQLRAMEVDIPSIQVQRDRVAKLKPYDDVVENNRKQIALLEETARRLYKEWFVDLHFPGHEDTEIVDGVPAGWEHAELGEVVFQSGSAVKKGDRDQFNHYLPIDSIPSMAITCWDSESIEKASSSLVSFTRDDFLFGAMRPYFHKAIVAPYKGLTRSTCLVLAPLDECYWAYSYMLLFAGDCVRYATAISVGTTMPYVRWDDFRHMPVILPTKNIANKFAILFKPLRDEVELLAKQNASLSDVRNRLLPKLMSGEIEVSA